MSPVKHQSQDIKRYEDDRQWEHHYLSVPSYQPRLPELDHLPQKKHGNLFRMRREKVEAVFISLMVQLYRGRRGEVAVLLEVGHLRVFLGRNERSPILARLCGQFVIADPEDEPPA